MRKIKLFADMLKKAMKQAGNFYFPAQEKEPVYLVLLNFPNS